jgi:hypothetical protein
MAELKKPGTYEFLQFRVSPFGKEVPFIDIRGMIHEWELIESMDSGNMHGSATVYDSIGLLDDFVLETGQPWLKGEEQILITYKDFFDETMTHKMFLYAITDVNDMSTAQNSARHYKIHFTSVDKFLTERYLIRRGFRDNTISTYVKQLFDAYYRESQHSSKKPIEITETEGDQNLVIPNYSPEQSMHFFARKAYGPAPRSVKAPDYAQAWRFFETRKKYYFTTHAELAASSAESFLRGSGGGDNTTFLYKKIDEADKTPTGNIQLQQSILGVSYPLFVDTLDDMIEGAYYSSTTELDFINRSPSIVEFRYLDDYDEYKSWPGPNARSKHSKKFVDEHMNLVRDRLVIKDYGSPNDPGGNNFVRPETYYPQMYNQKRVNLHHHNSQSFTVRAYGNNKVMPGSIIHLDLRKVSSKQGGDPDLLRNGRYLVESVRNVFSEDMFYHILTVSNSGIRGQKEPGNQYDRDRQALSSFTQEFNITRVSSGTNGGKNAVDGTKKDKSDNSGKRQLTGDQVDSILSGEDSDKARKSAESHLGRSMSDKEWSNLVAATVAESSVNSPKEQAYVMGVILNRTRENYGGYGSNVMDQLNARNQFQAVTGANGSGASSNFTNPSRSQIASTVSGVNEHLGSANPGWLNFTSNLTAAYGPGTNIGFRDSVRGAPDSQIVGGTVFGTVK